MAVSFRSSFPISTVSVCTKYFALRIESLILVFFSFFFFRFCFRMTWRRDILFLDFILSVCAHLKHRGAKYNVRSKYTHFIDTDIHKRREDHSYSYPFVSDRNFCCCCFFSSSSSSACCIVFFCSFLLYYRIEV